MIMNLEIDQENKLVKGVPSQSEHVKKLLQSIIKSLNADIFPNLCHANRV